MLKIKIFTAKNVQQYGFTDREIDGLNAEWELKASELGLEEHLPEYWQEAKRHMNEKLAGRVAESGEESVSNQPDAEPIELPSLDVSLDDFAMSGEDEITVVDLSDEEFEVEFLSDDIAELESIPGDDLEFEVISEELESKVAEAVHEQEVAAEEITQEEEAADEPVTVEVLELEEEEAAPEQGITVEEMAEEEEPAEEFVTAEEPELEEEEAFQEQTAAVEKSADEIAAEEEFAPVEEEKKKSFFTKIFSRLKSMFSP
ncbi:MAG: hypothetical protein KKA54_02500 [Proteobacteria bacterium]|nr:hypothetical protein [Pseudomonadota bacterium]